MAVVLYGNERYLMLEKANQLFEESVKKNGDVEKLLFQSSDARFDFNAVITAVETVSLFGMEKWIFLYVEKEKDQTKIDWAKVMQWLSGGVNLVLALPKKPDAKSSLRKTIKKYAQEITITVSGKDAIPVATRVNQAIAKAGLDLDVQAKELLIRRLGDNPARVNAEIDKLVLLGRKISLSDVEALVSYDMEQDLFALTSALLDQDHKEVFRVYHQLLKQKNDPLGLVPLIAASLRSLYQVVTLQEMHYGAHEIKRILKMSDGQYYHTTKRKIRSSASLLSMLNQLAAFEQGTKQGLGDPFVSFELLLLSISEL